MKRVILTVGPQGAGKSTFCEEVIKTHPEVILVSRDKILIELFGSVWLSPYTGGHLVGKEKMWEVVAGHLQRDGVVLILDCWNGFPSERHEITKKLRSLGADEIEAWYFITPQDTCLKWWLKKREQQPKPKSEKWREILERAQDEEYRDYHRSFHGRPVELDQGFDSIKRINPLEPPSFGLLLFGQESGPVSV